MTVRCTALLQLIEIFNSVPRDPVLRVIVFLAHPAAGSVLHYRQVARNLGLPVAAATAIAITVPLILLLLLA